MNMKTRRKVLWIEDGARADFQQMLGPVYARREFELIVALNASDAITHLKRTPFDVVIVDIRIPPGEAEEWRELHHRGDDNNANARLGLDLLYSLLAPESARINLAGRPAWITSEKFAVFTVESRTEVQDDLKRMGIGVFRRKETEMGNRVLLDVIEEVLRQEGGPPSPTIETGGNHHAA
jgi:CheY-like chemotaxis protein